MLAPGEQVSIPSGQFALLITEEVVSIPRNVVAFISIRARLKFRGLVNVSGFHVDPGFRGRLKFSVYNAGPQDVTVARGERLFPLWFSNLDEETDDVYAGEHLGQGEITSQDVMRMQGEVASPAALKKEFDALRTEYDKRIAAAEHSIGVWRGITVGFAVGIIVLIATVLLKDRLPSVNPEREPGRPTTIKSQ